MVEKILIKSIKNGLNLTIYVMETKPLDLGLLLYNKLSNYTNNI
jgi:translation initiation factor 2B subunit (eIF-2B alpha/beta/delta family)